MTPSFWSSVRLVARREVVERSRERSFLVSTGITLLVVELDPELEQVLQSANRQVRATRALDDAGFDPAVVARAQSVPALPVAATDPPDPDADARRAIVSVGTFVLYGQLIGYGFWVATGIVEEKSSRVVEVLLATVRPRALLAGKVLGIGLLALAQLLLVAVLGVGASAASGVIEVGPSAVEPVLLRLGWFVLGFAFYACLFAAGAARVSRQEDLQSVTTPGTMLRRPPRGWWPRPAVGRRAPAACPGRP